MKKLMGLILALVMCLTLAGCGGEKKETVKETVKETESATEQETIEPETEKEEVKEYGVGEPFTVETEYGDYIIMIIGISETDWWERAYQNTDSKVILVEYEVENIDFSNSMVEGVLIDSTCFKISDDKKYLLNSFSMRYDSINPMDITGPGYKRASSVPYVSERETEYYDIIFTRNTGDIAKVRINLQ